MRTAKLDEDQIQDAPRLRPDRRAAWVSQSGSTTTRCLRTPGRRSSRSARAGSTRRSTSMRSAFDDPNSPGPAGAGRIHELCRAAGRHRPERHVRDGRLRPGGYRGYPLDTGGLPRRALRRRGRGTTSGPPTSRFDDPAAMLVPTRVMTGRDLAALGIDRLEGGFRGDDAHRPGRQGQELGFGRCAPTAALTTDGARPFRRSARPA